MEAVLVPVAVAVHRVWAVVVLAGVAEAEVALVVAAAVVAVAVVAAAEEAAGGKNHEKRKSDYELNKLNSPLAKTLGGCHDNGAATAGDPYNYIWGECANN
jgi:ABC-type transport system involved in cytochrome bd biosynthesis fused ATPase/permease subunit